MYQVICTSYNETKKGLVLRDNWIETFIDSDDFSADLRLMNYLTNFKISTDFKYLSKNSISNILEGRTRLDMVVIHVRIVCF